MPKLPGWPNWITVEIRGTAMSDNDREFLLKSGVDSLQVVVDRADVESGNVEPILTVLRHLLVSPETVRAFMDRVHLTFAGYDEDPRELHQIQDVRAYVSKLDEHFPFWFYFINLYDDMLLVIQLILCGYTIDEQKGYVIDTVDLGNFLAKHYTALNWLIEKCGLGEELIERRSKRIDDFFGRKRERPQIH
jgi:hypothetical protein